MKVTIWHNIARECRYCDVAVFEHPAATPKAEETYTGPDGKRSCPKAPDGYHFGSLANFGGYKAGHPMVRVYETQLAAVTDPILVADVMFEAFNAPEECLHGAQLARATAYRARRLRSLSVGDVVQIGDQAFACESIGWVRIDLATLTESRQTVHGTVPLPPAEVSDLHQRLTTLREQAGDLPGTDVVNLLTDFLAEHGLSLDGGQ